MLRRSYPPPCGAYLHGPALHLFTQTQCAMAADLEDNVEFCDAIMKGAVRSDENRLVTAIDPRSFGI